MKMSGLPRARLTNQLIGAAIYATFGVAWILAGFVFSDTVFGQTEASYFELYKGLAFIGLSTAVVFVLLRALQITARGDVARGRIADDFRESIRGGERTLRWLPVGLGLLVFALFCLLLLGLGFLRERVLVNGEHTADALRYSVAAQVGGSLDLVEVTLSQVSDTLSRGAVASPHEYLQKVQPTVDKLVRALWVLDARGRIVHDSDTGNLGADLSSRDYFQHHRDTPRSGFFVGQPVKSRSTGTWFVSASRPMRSPTGELLGVVVAALDIDRFSRFWHVPVGQSSLSVALFRRDGLLLLRSPLREESIGKNFSNTHVWQSLIPNAQTGVYRADSSIDGESGIYAFGAIPGFPHLELIVGFPVTGLLADWRRFSFASLAALALVAGLLALFGVMFWHQLRGRIDSQKLSAALARYPLNSRNPVLTVARSGTPVFTNEAASRLLESAESSGDAAALHHQLVAMATARTDGASEFLIGNRVVAASYTRHADDTCDIHMTDLSELRESEGMLRLFFELPFAGMAITSPQTKRWIRFNDRLCEILGYPREELEQKTWAEITHPDDIDADTTHFERVLAGQSDAFTMEKRFIRPDGALVHAVIDVRPVRRFDRTITHFVAVVLDVTARRQAEQALRDARDSLEQQVKDRTMKLAEANQHLQELDHLKSLFIASMSHELRTPLNSIIGFTGMMLQKIPGPINNKQQDYLERVANAGRHLLALISDVIDIAKIEAGKAQGYVESFNLVALVTEAVDQIRDEADRKGLKLMLEAPQTLQISSDRRRLLQCLLNYLSNALKYTPDGTITVRLVPAHDDKGVEIVVQDTGIGIAHEDQGRLFQQFSRIDSDITRRTPGTGLGLYLTRKLAMDVLGGEVSMTSQPGEGSTFRLHLPTETKA